MTQAEIPTSKRPEAVRVKLLGGFSVSVGTRTIRQEEWRLKKAASLVKLLALAPGHRMHREQAIDLLWPDTARRRASNNLRQVLYGARKILDASPGYPERYLSLRDEQLVLCPEGQLWVDADAFEEAAATARRSQDPSANRAAIELYAGELLPEDRYEEWAEGRRNGLRQLYLALIMELAGLYEDREQHALAIEALRKATSEEPALEEAHASLMRLHALSGRPERALAQYERLRDALQSGIGTRPTEATRRLRDVIAAGELPTAPPADAARDGSSADAKHNLPAPMSSFVGREREMLDVKRALSMTRLLTLTGAGGSGKTRLSLEVARDLAGTYPGGVWLVELAPLSELGLVAQEVARTLGIKERPGEPLADTLVDFLTGKEMLLILDNCEHLVEEAARLVDVLLASCPNLSLLATSREPLGVSGEVNRTVPPLSLPDAANGGVTAEALMRYEAVRLFVDRARLRLPDFELTQENIRAVAGICRKLAGVPLAIELATARMGALAVEQVAQKLEASLDVLKSNIRSAHPRQQTLRATLDWSHDLLPKNERAFFARLSVFAGGWTLEAAEAVCSLGGIEKDDVLNLLGGLVDKSLVVAGSGTDGAVRYGMLEPIRQYAKEKLGHSGEVREVRGRHAVFFLALAEEAEPELLWGGEEQQRAWLELLEADHDNIRIALTWMIEREDADLGLRFAGALYWFWHVRAYFDEARRWLEGAMTKQGWTSATTRAKALDALAWVAYNQDDVDRAEAAATEGLELSEEAEIEPSLLVSFQVLLGEAARTRGDSDRAKELHEGALALSRKTGDKRDISLALNGLADFWMEQENYVQSKELYEESIALLRELGATVHLANGLINLGYLFLIEGDAERAGALNGEAAALLRKVGNRSSLPTALDNLGWATLLRGDHERAKAFYEESLRSCLGLGEKVFAAEKGIAAESLDGLACVAGILGEDERAARMFGAARTLHETVGYHHAPAERALREPYLTNVRSRLEEASWEAAFAEGWAMTFEKAVEYALSGAYASPAGNADGSGVSENPPLVALTPRGREVATLVARGLTNRQIATDLSISEHTVATHIAKIMKKLGLHSRAQISAWVTEQRIPSVNPD